MGFIGTFVIIGTWEFERVFVHGISSDFMTRLRASPAALGKIWLTHKTELNQATSYECKGGVELLRVWTTTFHVHSCTYNPAHM